MVAEDKGSLEAVKSANPVGNGQRQLWPRRIHKESDAHIEDEMHS